MIVSPDQRILYPIIPQADGHVVGARRDEALPVRRKLHLPDRHGVPVEDRHGRAEAPHIPNPNRLVNGGGGDDGVVVLVPIAGEDLEVVGGDDDGGGRLADVPDAEGAVSGGGGEDVGVAGVPDGGVDAVGVLLEGAEAGWAVDGPELDGVVPGGGEEGVAADGVPVDGVELAGVLVEGADGIGGGGEGEVEDLDGAVGDSGEEEVVVVLGPGAVVDAVGGVEDAELGDGGLGGRGELEDVEAAVAEYAEVLGGGDGESVLVEGAELYGVAIEGGFEERHRESRPEEEEDGRTDNWVRERNKESRRSFLLWGYLVIGGKLIFNKQLRYYYLLVLKKDISFYMCFCLAASDAV